MCYCPSETLQYLAAGFDALKASGVMGGGRSLGGSGAGGSVSWLTSDRPSRRLSEVLREAGTERGGHTELSAWYRICNSCSALQSEIRMTGM
jgi:hypothetical protein